MAHKESGLACVSETLIWIRAGAGRSWLGGTASRICREWRIRLALGQSMDTHSDSLDRDLVTVIVGNAVTPFLKLIGSELELVILVTEDTIGAACRIGESGSGGKVMAKVFVEVVIRGGNQNDPRSILAKNGGGELLEGGLIKMFDSAMARGWMKGMQRESLVRCA